MDAQELQKLNIAGIYHTSTGQTLREQDVPEVTKFAEAVIRAWAERAVSPAESVQSIDTPAFRELLLKMYKRTSFSSEILNAEAKAVIAHADIKIAAARAGGRRSALEELHPQWLKEKERADRAEGALKTKKTDFEQIRFRFFKDLIPSERLKVFKAFGIYPDNCNERVNHGIETMMLRRLLSSTAQVEPAKECGNCFEGKSDMDHACRACGGTGVANTAAKEAATAADTTFKTNAGPSPGDMPIDRFINGLPLPQYPAQATPEGADLPPAEYDTEMDRHYLPLPNGWEVQTKGNGSTFRIAHVPTGARYIVMDENLHEPLTDLAKDVRTALAAQQNSTSNSSNNSATTAAEPVYQMRHRIEPVWTDCSDFVVESWLENGGDPTRVRTLYRAAPPQQVAPMTPEMLRAVQLRSEVGTYITANWANAYDCLQEFWRVACEAQAKQQVDTGGLPG
jgi:hypothetical protein